MNVCHLNRLLIVLLLISPCAFAQKPTSLRDALKKVTNTFGTQFVYDKQLIDGKTTTYSLDNIAGKPVEEILKGLLYSNNLVFLYVKPNYYSIVPKDRVGTENQVETNQIPVSQSAISGNASAATNRERIRITGTVTDSGGKGIPNATVTERGTNNSTTTNNDGSFVISVNGTTSVLSVSSVGYEPKEITVGTQNNIAITLAATAAILEDVVVVGYGTQSKKDITGSISSVKAQDIRDIAATSVNALLQGKAAGVQVVQSSGTPGAEIFVRVRGTASLRADSRPLYVIDGVPMNNINGTLLDAGGQRTSALSDINPNDIESMEILKDASAAAIYGARASNGVVLITTKRGKSGNAKFSFDSYYGVQETYKTFDLLNGEQFVEVLKESRTNRGLSNTIAPFNQVTVTGKNTDYQKEVFRTAPIANYNLSVSGGDAKVNTFVSLGYFTQQGTIIGQDYGRFTGRLNLDYKATQNLKIGNSTTYSNATNARVANDFSANSILGNALVRNPNLAVRNDDGTYSVDPLQTENPVLLANEITFNSNQKRIISNFYAEYRILEGLSVRSVFGIDNLTDRLERFVPGFVVNRNGVSEAQAVSTDNFTWINDNTINFNKNIGDHSFSALAGFGMQQNKSSFLQAGGNTTGSNIITTIAVANPSIPNHDLSGWSLVSYFGRANYNFRDKYLVNGSFRVDGSSRFGANKRYGLFPAVSAGWRIINEPFMERINGITDLKLRVGIGTTGNQEGLGNFGSLALYATGRNYDGRPGIAQSNVPNADLGWESTVTTNVGLDISLLKSRINLTFDAYLKETKDLLFTRQLPWTSGFGEIQNVNVGTMQNKGIEFALNTRNLTGAFSWTTDFNISFNRNKITSLPVNGSAGSDLVFKLPDAYSIEGPYSIYRVGQPVGSFYGYKFLGVYARDEDVPREPKDASGRSFYDKGVRAGDPIFLDVNGDASYDRQFDRVLIGNALPIHTGGLTNNFSYKGIDLSVFMNWSYGNDIFNVTKAVLTSATDDFNQSTDVLRRWRKPGDITDIPKALYGSNSVSGATATDANSRFIEDGSFLRVRNVTLGYNLPASILKKAKIASSRIYVSAQNLFTFTNYSGLDPENQNTGGGLVPTLGVDFLTQPQPRVYMVGINLGF